MLPCLPDFLNQLATDFGVTEVNRAKVAVKLTATFAFYQTQTSGTSLAQLVDDAQRDAVREFGFLEARFEDAAKTFIIGAVIAVIVLSLFGFYFIRDITRSTWFLVILLIVVIAVIAGLYYLFYRTVRNQVLIFSRRINALYDELVTNIQRVITQDEVALLAAICYYGNIP